MLQCTFYRRICPYSCLSSQTRPMSKKRRPRLFKKKITVDDAGTSVSGPTFPDLMRKLQLRTHPDLIRSIDPMKADANETGMQVINGMLDTCKQNPPEYPPAITKRIPIYIKDGEDGFTKIILHIETAGGDCRRQMTTSFERFFREAALLDKDKTFNWGPYFPI